ncbi:hypothetical protein [Streptomyces sp. NPDC046862]|uniref:hypothetical protein n=1 Tax=Streptomyces sp. NPDC046862 TaxID=3154603 RepID=UPI0034529D8B
MSTPIEPGTYYDVTVRCNTRTLPNQQGQGDPQPCPNYERVWDVTEVYSNAGQLRVQCGLCQKDTEILTATKMDPQPEVS